MSPAGPADSAREREGAGALRPDVRPDVRIGALARLAWPAVLSYILSNAYRINDQFWIQGLGGPAQAAVGATMFVLIMNFALVFLCVGGTLALVARATGAGDRERRDRVLRAALALGLVLGCALTVLGSFATPTLVDLIGLSGETAERGREYLQTLYLGMLAMVFVPLLDNALIGMGNTLVPMAMQVTSLGLNFFLNPVLIYGRTAPEHVTHAAVRPVAEIAAWLAESFGMEGGLGMQGAALATIASRLVASLIGLGVLLSHYRVKLRGRVEWRIARDVLAISAPVSGSIALYAGVYWVLLGVILKRLGQAEIGGLGIGFQVFEGFAFPCFLGVAQACASLVGRSLGAGSPDSARRAVGNGYRLAGTLGLALGLAFYFAGPALVPFFTQDPAIAAAAIVYVRTLAFSQLFVAFESVGEKSLIGAGVPRPAVAVSIVGNLARLPLAWILALELDLGGAGVWWAINATTLGKAAALAVIVRRGRWLTQRVGSD